MLNTTCPYLHRPLLMKCSDGLIFCYANYIRSLASLIGVTSVAIAQGTSACNTQFKKFLPLTRDRGRQKSVIAHVNLV
jgi:hypothetical protein